MADETTAEWTAFDARVVGGHQVASGRGGDPRFPGGTLRMQMPFFLERGLDLSAFHPGTLNVSLAPLAYRVLRSRFTFRQVRWHPTAQAEDFSFFDVRLLRGGRPPIEGLIYYPHPDTKPEHFQKPDVLELLLPHVDGLTVGTDVRLAVRPEQIDIVPA